MRECTIHYAILTIEALQKSRKLLTRPVLRLDRKSRTWLLDPSEIEIMLARLQAEGQQLN